MKQHHIKNHLLCEAHGISVRIHKVTDIDFNTGIRSFYTPKQSPKYKGITMNCLVARQQFENPSARYPKLQCQTIFPEAGLEITVDGNIHKKVRQETVFENGRRVKCEYFSQEGAEIVMPVIETEQEEIAVPKSDPDSSDTDVSWFALPIINTVSMKAFHAGLKKIGLY